LASGLITAGDDQEQAAASLSNATPALLPPTIDCHRKLPDGRLHHRNRPFVLVGATGWVMPRSRHWSDSSSLAAFKSIVSKPSVNRS
jgi:hypothetical protein